MKNPVCQIFFADSAPLREPLLFPIKSNKGEKVDEKNRLALAEWVMESTLKCGADQSAVSISAHQNISIEFREKKIEQLTESLQSSLSLEIYANQRYSSHSTNDLRKEFLSGFIENAVKMTSYLAKDEYRSLPDPKYYPKNPPAVSGGTGDFYSDFKLCDNDYDRIPASLKIQTAAEIEEAARSEESERIISVTSWYSDSYSESLRIHSNGFTEKARGTGFSAGAEVTVRDEHSGGRPEESFGASSRFRSDLPDAQTLGRKARERALRKIGQKKIVSGKYDMIVENRVGARMISTLLGPMGGGALQQKSSFLEGMAGKKIASEKLTVIDEPLIEKGFGTRFFDGEGLKSEKRVMIDKGVLKYYYIDTYYGKKLGMEPTSGSASNIIFDCGSNSLEAMIGNLKKGIWVTGFIGGNSNSTTGDFSFGIVGLLIENGEVVRPVNEMNVSGNAKEFWNCLAETGNDPYPYSGLRMPSMMFEGVNFSGI